MREGYAELNLDDIGVLKVYRKEAAFGMFGKEVCKETLELNIMNPNNHSEVNTIQFISEDPDCWYHLTPNNTDNGCIHKVPWKCKVFGSPVYKSSKCRLSNMTGYIRTAIFYIKDKDNFTINIEIGANQHQGLYRIDNISKYDLIRFTESI